MPHTCAAFGCKNRCIAEANGKLKLSFHRRKLQERLLAVRRRNFTPSKYHRLCSDHFTEDCFAPRSPLHIRRILKKDAAPTVFDFKGGPRKSACDGKGGWKTNLKVLDEGIYPEAGATTLCTCDLPEKLEDSNIVKLASECSPNGTDSVLHVPASRSECGMKTVRKGGVSTRSLTCVVEQLNSAHREIKELMRCIKMYEQEHMELHMERVNALIRTVHLIKRNAVDGDINAIMLLNQIALYVPQE